MKAAHTAALVAAALLLLLLPSGSPGRADEGEAAVPSPSLEYRTSSEVSARLADLARRAWDAGLSAEVVPYGTSHGGRPLEALEIGRSASRLLVHGGLGWRDAAGTVACLDLAERILRGEGQAHAVSWLLIPAPNPDALDAFLAGRAPAGGGRVDRDKDGRRGEDGPSDIDGDGEILWMRRRARTGTWAPVGLLSNSPNVNEAEHGRLRDAGVDTRRPISYEVFREGLDDDADGLVNEDGPALDCTRQFTGFRDDKGPWRGDGPFPGYAPEVRALMELSFATTGLVAWWGFTGEGRYALRASEQGKEADADNALYGRIGKALKEGAGLETKRAHDVLGWDQNPASDLDWACVHLGCVAFRVPVWRSGDERPNAKRFGVMSGFDGRDDVSKVTDGALFRAWRPFEHPTLGAVEIGGWKRHTRYEPPPALLTDAAKKASLAPLQQVRFVPRLAADVRVEKRGSGLAEIVVRALNAGDGATDTLVAERHRRMVGVRLTFEPRAGVTLLAGTTPVSVGRLRPGQASKEVRWLVRVQGDGGLGHVHVTHPKADPVIVEVNRK